MNMIVQVTTRRGQTVEYTLPDQYDINSSIEDVSHHVASTHAGYMIYIDNSLAFIDWSKGMLIKQFEKPEVHNRSALAAQSEE